MKSQNYEKTLPAQYTRVYRLDAADKRTGLILSFVSLLPLIPVMAVAVALLVLLEKPFFFDSLSGFSVLFFSLGLFLYIILHELVHGAAYKALTGEKLSFGFKWSCAFCGVPHIYTYRKTAMIAVIAPFAVFSLLLLGLTAALLFLDPVFYLFSALLFAIHLGGCVGDLYLFCLLLFKYKSGKLLMKDTGPEMTLYLPSEGTIDS
jgi:hypothetical protein